MDCRSSKISKYSLLNLKSPPQFLGVSVSDIALKATLSVFFSLGAVTESLCCLLFQVGGPSLPTR